MTRTPIAPHHTGHALDACNTSGINGPNNGATETTANVEPQIDANPQPAPSPIEAARYAVKCALQLARSTRERVEAVKVENRQRIVEAKQDAENAEHEARTIIGRVLADLAFSGELDDFMGPTVRKPSADLEEAIEEAEAQERFTAECRQRVLELASGNRTGARPNGVRL